MNGIELIATERQRQIEIEGWTAEHDRQWKGGELIRAAICYASDGFYRWPWEKKFYKPVDQKKDLIRAGALIAAELDRLMDTDND